MMHIFGVTLQKCGYILGVLKPQQYLADVIETVNSQNWYNYIIGFDTSNSINDLAEKVTHRVFSTGGEYYEHTFWCFI